MDGPETYGFEPATRNLDWQICIGAPDRSRFLRTGSRVLSAAEATAFDLAELRVLLQ
jgi:hypothetical protein